jgi:hypothetical protein
MARLAEACPTPAAADRQADLHLSRQLNRQRVRRVVRAVRQALGQIQQLQDVLQVERQRVERLEQQMQDLERRPMAPPVTGQSRAEAALLETTSSCETELPVRPEVFDARLADHRHEQDQAKIEALLLEMVELKGQTATASDRYEARVREVEENYRQELQRIGWQRDELQQQLAELYERAQHAEAALQREREERQEERLLFSKIKPRVRPIVMPTDGDRDDRRVDETEDLPAGVQSAPTAAGPLATGAAPVPMEASAPDEVAIEDYMNALMRRMGRTADVAKPSVAAPVPTVTPAVRTATAAPIVATVESTRLPSTEGLVPVAKMPAIDLSAMRDVANQTARVAIRHHWERRGMQDAFVKWTLALCAVAVGCVLGMMPNPHHHFSAALIASVGMFVAAAYWGVQGVVCLFHAKLATRAVRSGVARTEPETAEEADEPK